MVINMYTRSATALIVVCSICCKPASGEELPAPKFKPGMKWAAQVFTFQREMTLETLNGPYVFTGNILTNKYWLVYKVEEQQAIAPLNPDKWAPGDPIIKCPIILIQYAKKDSSGKLIVGGRPKCGMRLAIHPEGYHLVAWEKTLWDKKRETYIHTGPGFATDVSELTERNPYQTEEEIEQDKRDTLKYLGMDGTMQLTHTKTYSIDDNNGEGQSGNNYIVAYPDFNSLKIRPGVWLTENKNSNNSLNILVVTQDESKQLMNISWLSPTMQWQSMYIQEDMFAYPLRMQMTWAKGEYWWRTFYFFNDPCNNYLPERYIAVRYDFAEDGKPVLSIPGTIDEDYLDSIKTETINYIPYKTPRNQFPTLKTPVQITPIQQDNKTQNNGEKKTTAFNAHLFIAFALGVIIALIGSALKRKRM